MNNSFLRKREIDSSFFHCTKPAILDWDCKFLSRCVDNGPRIALQRHQQYSQVSLQRHFKHEVCAQNSHQPISPHFVNSVQTNVAVPPIVSKIAPIYVSFLTHRRSHLRRSVLDWGVYNLGVEWLKSLPARTRYICIFVTLFCINNHLVISMWAAFTGLYCACQCNRDCVIKYVGLTCTASVEFVYLGKSWKSDYLIHSFCHIF